MELPPYQIFNGVDRGLQAAVSAEAKMSQLVDWFDNFQIDKDQLCIGSYAKAIKTNYDSFLYIWGILMVNVRIYHIGSVCMLYIF